MGRKRKQPINLIFMAHFQYPHGMASTKRVQNSIDYLRRFDDVHIKVLVLRQGRVTLAESELSGTHKGVEYVTIGSDIKPNLAALYRGVKYFIDGMRFLKRNRRRDGKNIIYVYGYPSTDNVPLLVFAKMLGYRILFDIVEDITYQKSADDLLARLKNWSALCFCRVLWVFADAVLVVSRHLYEKTVRLARQRFPVHLYPISVDFGQFDGFAQGFHEPIRILYGGTFARKDGVENLLAAFETIASRHANVMLILTGKGAPDRMEIIHNIIAASNHRDRIEYKGYLQDEQYYSFLNGCDILCMTRTGSRFAQAGFPFKLGEYLASGKPVVASKVSNVTDYLEDRKNALLVEPDSVESIAEAIEFLIDNPQRAGEIGRRGRETAKANFDAAILGGKLRQILEDI